MVKHGRRHWYRIRTANHENTQNFKHRMRPNKLMKQNKTNLSLSILFCICAAKCPFSRWKVRGASRLSLVCRKAYFGAMADKSKSEMPSTFVVTFNFTWRLENTRAASTDWFLRTVCTHKMRGWTINFVAASFVLMRYFKLHIHFAHYRVRPYNSKWNNSKELLTLRECIDTNAIPNC